MSRAAKSLLRHRPFCAMAAIALLWVLLAAAAPWVAPYDPFQVDMEARLQEMSAAHWLGTDQLGRDELSRILYGGRLTMSVAFCIVLATSMGGIFLGTVIALCEGRANAILSRILDLFLAFPSMVLSIALVGILGPSLVNIMLSLIVTKWAEYARVARALVLSEKAKGYVRLSRFSGASFITVICRYILPNVIPQLLVLICQHIGDVILTVAGLSLIGIGIPPPHPEWGTLLMGSRDYMQTAPWLLIYPGMAIFLTVVIFNLLGDVTRDALDPHRAADER